MATRTDPADAGHMAAALSLARRGLGRTWPNPSVGCVIVRDGRVVARGWTQPGGRPHAEREALDRAGPAARGATAYVSLEPCDHHGQTPPCSLALIEAGIARAAIAIEDPDPRVNGSGIARLRGAGVAVDVGLLGDEARVLNEGFLRRLRDGRPIFTWKAATTLDGRIATRTGESRWITGAAARALAHQLRATHDAIMVGAATALADDPELTCRLPGLADRSPVRIVVDTNLRLSLGCKLVRSARDFATWVVTVPDVAADRRAALESAGVEVVTIAPSDDGRPGIAAIAAELGRRGLTRVLVEGGGRLVASLLAADLVDRAVVANAGSVIGGDGVPVVAPFGLSELGAAPKFVLDDVGRCGDDVVEFWTRSR